MFKKAVKRLKKFGAYIWRFIVEEFESGNSKEYDDYVKAKYLADALEKHWK